MNIHPLLVHFPIAFLALYAICELIRFKKVIAQHYWFHVKAILIIAGLVTAELALVSGEAIEKMFRDENPTKDAIVPVHSASAEGTIGIFLILAISYLVLWIEYDSSKKFLVKYPSLASPWERLIKIAKWIIDTPASLVLALIGIVGITITGALGGAMVHGPEVDPFVSFVYHLFF
ncbi:MAG TPA: hypothetical protein DCS23_00485 [Candidatus Yonathbacteria bacterium]|nr:hypothetical protein [Candidatus Yonathbacteria bacterium]